ncbi:hypothetical protein OKW33_004029 [Paraburkholderia atlantica]
MSAILEELGLSGCALASAAGADSAPAAGPQADA